MATTDIELTPELIAEADRVHARLLELKRSKNLIDVELANLLAHVAREQLQRRFGKTSVAEYAVCFGFTPSYSKARDLVKMMKDLESAPTIRAEFERGDHEWTKVRTAAAAVAANPDKEHVWLDRLHRKVPAKRLEVLARKEAGDPTPVHRSFELTEEDAADLEQAVALARARYGRTLTDAQALAIVCRSWSATQAGGGSGGEGPANRIVINRCGDCDRTWRETRSGQVPVSPQRYEAAACDAEVSDVREGPARITKTVPPKVRGHVLDRDGHRCRVPACSSVGFLHVHHEPGREVSGHDPARMTPLCDQHHLQRHEGFLEIREEGEGRFRFFLVDGTELVADDAEVAAPRSRESTSTPEGASTPARCSHEDCADEADGGCWHEGMAVSVVCRLVPVDAQQAAAAVRRARDRLLARGEPVHYDTLVKAARTPR